MIYCGLIPGIIGIGLISTPGLSISGTGCGLIPGRIGTVQTGDSQEQGSGMALEDQLPATRPPTSRLPPPRSVMFGPGRWRRVQRFHRGQDHLSADLQSEL
jgi:hypothetical protein